MKTDIDNNWDELFIQVYKQLLFEKARNKINELDIPISILMRSIIGDSQHFEKKQIQFTDELVLFMKNVDLNLSMDQRKVFKAALNNSLKSLAPSCNPPNRNTISYDVIKAISQYLHNDKDVKILFKGSILKENREYLNKLFSEASSSIKNQQDNHYSSKTGPIGNTSHLHKPIKSILEDIGVSPSKKSYSNYIFYEAEGDYNSLHVDREEYGINMLININPSSNKDSFLTMFDNDSFFDTKLGFGEIIVFLAGSLIHGRKPIKKGENVTLLTVGFSY